MKIVCLGDSITDNRENKTYTNYWQKLIDQKHLDHQIINAGVSGETAAEGYQRLDRDVLSHQPDLVTIMFGHNELGRGETVEICKSNLNLIIEKISKTFPNCKIWILTPNKVNNPQMLDRYKPLLKFLRTPDTRFNLVDIWEYFPEQDLDPLYTNMFNYDGFTGLDWLHPNSMGQKLIAKKLMQELTNS